MNINALHADSRGKNKTAEDKLFVALTERFRYFAELKISDSQDAEEVAQKALMTVFKKYRDIEFKVSFSAWAHKVLENEILKYYRTRGRHESRFVREAVVEGTSASMQVDPDLKIRLVDCMKKLCDTNVRYARVLGLHYQGYDSGEICHKLELTINNFYVLLSRSRTALKRCLKTGGFAE